MTSSHGRPKSKFLPAIVASTTAPVTAGRRRCVRAAKSRPRTAPSAPRTLRRCPFDYFACLAITKFLILA